MARGFLSGLIWGGVVSVAGAGVVSVLTDGPAPPDVAVSAPQSAQVPVDGDPSTAGAVTDADLVRDGEAQQTTSPAADDVSAAVAAGADTPTVPVTGNAEGLSGPAQTGTIGSLAVLDAAPVLPSPQAVLPSAPDADGALSISTDPAQPPAPAVPDADGAFEATDAPEISTDPVQPRPPAVTETAAIEPETATPDDADASEGAAVATEDDPDATAIEAPTPEPAPADTASAPETPQTGTAAALPSVLDPAPAPTEGPKIGRQAISLVDRSTEPEADPATMTEETVDLPPIQANANAFENADDRPLMAIVLIDSGVDLSGGPVGLAALQSFPYPLSFAVDASLPDAGQRMAEYRAQGFEVMTLMDLPQGATAADAEVSLSVVLANAPKAVAVMEGVGTGVQGSRETSDQITEALKSSGHGLVLQSKGLNTAQKLALREGVPTGLVFRDFDSAGQTASVIRRFLDQAAFRAGQEGGVIMVGRLRPETISALLLWGLQDRAERVALAPISAVLMALATDP